MTQPLSIGLSACFFHADPQRAIFKGKTLLYLEQSAAHWLMSAGVLAYMLPSAPHGQRVGALLSRMDALVLQAGADVCPRTYGEEPLRPEWSGDAVRDAYEIELFREAKHLNKPVLGICRGAQLINVACGGTLFQDIQTQTPQAQAHRDWQVYDQKFHEVSFVPGGYLAHLYPSQTGGRVNTVHHQAVKDLGDGLQVEAHAVGDNIIEAVRLKSTRDGDPYVVGVQWHPEFQDPSDASLLPTRPLLQAFLSEVDTRR